MTDGKDRKDKGIHTLRDAENEAYKLIANAFPAMSAKIQIPIHELMIIIRTSSLITDDERNSKILDGINEKLDKMRNEIKSVSDECAKMAKELKSSADNVTDYSAKFKDDEPEDLKEKMKRMME